MFGGLANLIQSPPSIDPPPKNVPPPTPVALPQYHPQLPFGVDSTGDLHTPKPSLVRFLQTLHRPQDVSDAHFAAIGAHVHADVPIEALLPDTSYVPSPKWDSMTPDEARDANDTYQRPLSSNRSAPGPQVYLERREELSVANQAAFRTVRRIRPEPGQAVTRLGNSYEFFKQLELMAGYWDDTSLPTEPLETNDTSEEINTQDEEKEGKKDETAMNPSLDNTNATAEKTSGESDVHSKPSGLSSPPSTPSSSLSSSLPAQEKPQESPASGRITYRVFPGATMPPEFRHNLVSAFVKVIAYDFGCALAPPRVEPRMHILEPPSLDRDHHKALSSTSSSSPAHQQKASYIPSGCVFITRIPETREAARQGIIEGPVAAVSARNSTGFTKPSDARIDFGREIVAALATAQLRARGSAGGNSDGKPEMRFGQGKWWATARRWGGGEGGPIGREIESSSHQGTKGNAASTPRLAGTDSTIPPSHETSPISPSVEGDTVKSVAAIGSMPISPPPRTTSASRFPPPSLPLPLPMRGPPLAKRARKSHTPGPSIYDRYRAIRPPQSNWDKKARYEAIGRPSSAPPVAEVTLDRLPGAQETQHPAHTSIVNNDNGGGGGVDTGEAQQCHYLYYDDDIFVISSIFHHMCVLRFRVPGRLLAVLDGAPEGSAHATSTDDGHNGKREQRAWGRLEVWRTRWFDMFLVEDRLEAMKAIWGTIGYLMRVEEKSDQVEKDHMAFGSGSEDTAMKDA